MKVLDAPAVEQKIRRMAYQIYEHNYDVDELILLGINNNGYRFAELLYGELQRIVPWSVRLYRLRLNPAAPDAEPVRIEGIVTGALRGRSIVVIDDVANTGRTLFYAMKPLMETLPASVQTAVLVDRKHKSFPVQPDYVGLSLATTVQDHIQVHLDRPFGVELI